MRHRVREVHPHGGAPAAGVGDENVRELAGDPQSGRVGGGGRRSVAGVGRQGRPSAVVDVDYQSRVLRPGTHPHRRPAVAQAVGHHFAGGRDELPDRGGNEVVQLSSPGDGGTTSGHLVQLPHRDVDIGHRRVRCHRRPHCPAQVFLRWDVARVVYGPWGRPLLRVYLADLVDERGRMVALCQMHVIGQPKPANTSLTTDS